MLFLVISILGALGLIIWSISAKSAFFTFVMALLGIFVVSITVILGFSTMPKEFDKPEIIEEVTIHSFSKLDNIDKEKGEVYLYKEGDVYTYVTEQNFGIQNEEEKLYEENELSDFSMRKEIYVKEISDISKSRLVTYKEKGKASLMALPQNKITYIFYVPEGTVREK